MEAKGVLGGNGVGVRACFQKNPHHSYCLGLYREAERRFMEAKGVLGGNSVGVRACFQKNPHHFYCLVLYREAERCFI